MADSNTCFTSTSLGNPNFIALAEECLMLVKQVDQSVDLSGFFKKHYHHIEMRCFENCGKSLKRRNNT